MISSYLLTNEWIVIKKRYILPLKYCSSVVSSHSASDTEIFGSLVGDEVFLKSILNSTETVARGRVRSLDPNDLVGGIEIGLEWCEVNVQVPIKKR
ncbi:putative transposase, Tnp1/En/Spm [Helianthus annuus]|nr:putative transposase, Tnp1/En/Spm [Helianthus annuus]